MHPLLRRLSRTLATATALTLLVTPAAAVAAPGTLASVTGAGLPAVVDDPPLEASTPTIDGTLRVGSTLRALAGDWTSGTSFTYQWFADGEAISGATGFTFTPTWEQRGTRLSVRLDGSRAGYAPVSRTSAATYLIYAGYISQGLPVIVGSATPGATLTATKPPSVPADASLFSYRWRLDGESIRGANKSTLTMREAWRGHEITVTATVEKAGYVVERVTSPAARVGGAYSKSPNPVISGTKRVGSTLKVARGTWSPMPTSFSFQWYADGQRIAGATKSAYTLKASDYNKKITVSARSYRAGYGTVLRRSAATAPVLASATRWVGADEQDLAVGPDDVRATLYIAQARSAECTWSRRVGTEVVGSGVGSGQRMFKVIDTDDTVRASENCGVWIKYYPGMVTTSASTATDGVYVIDDHIERGVYTTSGPADAGTPCTYTFYRGFYGQDAVISEGTVTEPTTVTMPSNAVGLETAGCSWTRVG
jgi:hypothetical protein